MASRLASTSPASAAAPETKFGGDGGAIGAALRAKQATQWRFIHEKLLMVNSLGGGVFEFTPVIGARLGFHDFHAPSRAAAAMAFWRTLLEFVEGRGAAQQRLDSFVVRVAERLVQAKLCFAVTVTHQDRFHPSELRHPAAYGSRCIHCAPLQVRLEGTRPAVFAADLLLNEMRVTAQARVWLDPWGRTGTYVVTPQDHFERLSEMSDEEVMALMGQVAEVCGRKNGGRVEDGNVTIPHGRYRRTPHLAVYVAVDKAAFEEEWAPHPVWASVFAARKDGRGGDADDKD